MEAERMLVTTLAKKLREQLKKHQADRKAAVAEFERDFISWKAEMSKWLMQKAPSALAGIQSRDVREVSYSDRSLGFNADLLLRNAPKPPDYAVIKEFDRRMSSIRGALHRFGITGQKHATVTDKDIKSWFGEADEDD